MNKNIRDVKLMARAILKDEELMKTIDEIIQFTGLSKEEVEKL